MPFPNHRKTFHFSNLLLVFFFPFLVLFVIFIHPRWYNRFLFCISTTTNSCRKHMQILHWTLSRIIGIIWSSNRIQNELCYFQLFYVVYWSAQHLSHCCFNDFVSISQFDLLLLCYNGFSLHSTIATKTTSSSEKQQTLILFAKSSIFITVFYSIFHCKRMANAKTIS